MQDVKSALSAISFSIMRFGDIITLCLHSPVLQIIICIIEWLKVCWSLFFVEVLTYISSTQINGIAVDNKSVTECEALLRGCRDSLSLSLMKVSICVRTYLCVCVSVLCSHFQM